MTRTELIAALEAATGPSRELDARIQCELDGLYFGRHCSGRLFKARRIFKGGQVKDYAENFKSKPYTESIDAALSFTPERWRVHQLGQNGLLWRANLFTTPANIAPTTAWARAVAATPAIALCIANLRALEAQEEA